MLQRIHSRRRPRAAGIGSCLAAGMGVLAMVTGCSSLEGAPAAPPARDCCAASPRPVRAPARVRWAKAAPPADAPVLARWRATVGAPLVWPAPAGQAAAVTDELVVVSWNVHVGGGDIPRLVRELRAGRLTGGRPAAAFVLLLQEAYRAGADLPALAAGEAVPARIAPPPPEGARRDVAATAGALGLSLLYVPSMRNGAGSPGSLEDGAGALAEDRGNAILSSLPLVDAAALELPFEVQRRVSVAATVAGRTPAGIRWRLRVVSAHLDTRGPWTRPLAVLGGARLAQARALAAALAEEHPIVLGADLNTWGASPFERAIPFLRGQFPSTPRDPPGGTFEVGLGITRPLDHMFFRLPEGWRATVRRASERYGSDHYPLIAELRLTPRAGD